MYVELILSNFLNNFLPHIYLTGYQIFWGIQIILGIEILQGIWKSDRHPVCDREGGLQSKVRKIFKIGKIYQIGPHVLDGRSDFLFTHSIFPSIQFFPSKKKSSVRFAFVIQGTRTRAEKFSRKKKKRLTSGAVQVELSLLVEGSAGTGQTDFWIFGRFK